MSRYAATDEERMFVQGQVRDWTRVGLLRPDQGAQLESELSVNLRRTGRMLRLGLAGFTVVAVAAAVGFIVLLADWRSDRSAAVLVLMAGAGCVVGADRLVVRYRLYRHGIEEALAISGVVLMSLGIGLLISTSHFSWVAAMVGALATGAAGGFGVYLWFGLRYAAVAAMVCVAFIPLQMRLPVFIGLLVASAALAGIFAWARGVRRMHPDSLMGDDARTLEAVAMLGAYLVLNLEISGRLLGIGGGATLVSWFKWTTYAVVWLLPPMILWLRRARATAARRGDRHLAADPGHEQDVPRPRREPMGSDRVRRCHRGRGDRPPPVDCGRTGRGAKRLHRRTRVSNGR